MDNQITTMQEVTPATQKAYDTHARILANGQVMARALVDVCHDLKTMRDEGLYTELGYDTFEEYAEQACGIKQRQAYSYISAYEKLGQKYMADHADLGITKLELISQINSYEREEFAADVDLESATVRELKAEVERYKKQTEQLTFDLGQAQSELSEAPEPVDMDTLRSSIEQGVKAKYSAQLEELQQRADAAPDPEAIRKEAKKEAAKEYKAKLATAKADAEEKTKAAVEKLEQEKADLKRQLDSSATKLDAAVGRRHGCSRLPGVFHRTATNRRKGTGADRQDQCQGPGHRSQALRRRYSSFAVDCTEFGGGTMTCEQCYHRDVCWHRMTIYGPYALMGINTGNMKAWCANCKPKTQIIELSMQVSQSLHDELTKYCAERVVDEL